MLSLIKENWALFQYDLTFHIYNKLEPCLEKQTKIDQ